MGQYVERPRASGMTFASLAVIGLLAFGQLINTLHQPRVELLPPASWPARVEPAAEAEAGMSLLLVRQAGTPAGATGGACLADLAEVMAGAPRALVMVGDAAASPLPASNPASDAPCGAGGASSQ